MIKIISTPLFECMSQDIKPMLPLFTPFSKGGKHCHPPKHHKKYMCSDKIDISVISKYIRGVALYLSDTLYYGSISQFGNKQSHRSSVGANIFKYSTMLLGCVSFYGTAMFIQSYNSHNLAVVAETSTPHPPLDYRGL